MFDNNILNFTTTKNTPEKCPNSFCVCGMVCSNHMIVMNHINVRLVCGMDCEVCELDGKLELAVTRLNIELCCLNA